MKICRYCRTRCEDSAAYCPGCQSTNFITEADLNAKAEASEKQRLKEEEIIMRHKKRIMILRISAVSLIVVIALVVLIGKYIDDNRVIYVNGIAMPTKNEMANAYEMGLAYYEAGDWGNAIEQMYIVDERSPKFKDAQKVIIQANAKQEEIQALLSAQNAAAKRDAIQKANAYLEVNDYASALSMIKPMADAMPDDAELQIALTDISIRYKNDYIQRIDSYINAGKNTDAAALIQTALQVFPNDEDFLAKAGSLQISNVLAEATAKEVQGDLAGAIDILRNADGKAKSNPTIAEALNRLEANYKQQVILDAQSANASSGYLEAVQIIQSGIAVFPEDSELLGLKEEYLAKAPVELLATFDELEQKDFSLHNSGEDNLGNAYGRVIAVGGDADAHITFYIDGEYSWLTGTVYVRNSKKSTQYAQSLKIYGDDLLLYESERLTAGTLPIDFDISIAGVKKIRFATGERSATFGIISVGNLLLYK